MKVLMILFLRFACLRQSGESIVGGRAECTKLLGTKARYS